MKVKLYLFSLTLVGTAIFSSYLRGVEESSSTTPSIESLEQAIKGVMSKPLSLEEHQKFLHLWSKTPTAQLPDDYQKLLQQYSQSPKSRLWRLLAADYKRGAISLTDATDEFLQEVKKRQADKSDPAMVLTDAEMKTGISIVLKNYARSGNWDQIAPWAEVLVKHFPEDPIGYWWLSRASYYADYQDRVAAEKGGRQPQLPFDKRPNLKKELDALTEVLVRDPNHQDAHARVARIFLRQYDDKTGWEVFYKQMQLRNPKVKPPSNEDLQ